MRFRPSSLYALSVPALALGAAPVLAQAQTGRIVGRVVDAATGAGLADVGVQVAGTTIGTLSGVDGRFTLPAVPAGSGCVFAIATSPNVYRVEEGGRSTVS